jgi:hypothetical protein
MNAPSASRNAYQLSQDYEVLQPACGKAYPILCSEWEYLKKKISKISDKVNIYHTIGSVLIGAGLSTLIGVLSGGFTNSQNAGVPIGIVVAVACIIVLLVCGSISIYFAFEKRKVSEVKASDVIDQMEIIEQRFQEQTEAQELAKAGTLEIIRAIYGSKDKNVNVTEKIRSMVLNNRLLLVVNNELVDHDDPCPNIVKSLRLKYRFKNRVLEIEVRERDILAIP